ncbi:hypothetical protein BGZ81_003022 [Podila clonocystis]|nr:hypothetical protein BGZ81_003022 [Podila clonocystis]
MDPPGTPAHTPLNMAKEQEEYNVLLLGETQSGKSTLIEFLSAYADPNYTINEENVGDSIFSKTDKVRTTTIHTDLPPYLVTDKEGERVDYDLFLDQDQEDYEDELNERKKYLLERGEATAATATFNLFDTPGLNDTSKFDEKNLAIIFKALEGVKSIHLVVITVSNNPFTEGLQNALSAYINFFPEFNGSIVFVHTKIDYGKLHEQERQFVNTFNEKKVILHKLAGRDSVPHLLIDNDIGSTRTIRNCITQNTLRELLGMAKLNEPVPLQVMVMNKTEKMRTVDMILRGKFEDNIAVREKTLGYKNLAQKAVLATIGDLKAKIAKYEQLLLNIKRDRSFRDRDEMCLLHEDEYKPKFQWFKRAEPKNQMYYPEKHLVDVPGFIHHVIDRVRIEKEKVELESEEGGKGHKVWGVKFRRKTFRDGKLRVKIYIEMRKKYVTELEELNTQDKAIRGHLLNCRHDLKTCEQDAEEDMRAIEGLMVELKLDLYLHARVSMTQLESKVFHALVEANVYVHQDSESAKNLETFYRENRDKLGETSMNEKPVDA